MRVFFFLFQGGREGQGRERGGREEPTTALTPSFLLSFFLLSCPPPPPQKKKTKQIPRRLRVRLGHQGRVRCGPRGLLAQGVHHPREEDAGLRLPRPPRRVQGCGGARPADAGLQAERVPVPAVLHRVQAERAHRVRSQVRPGLVRGEDRSVHRGGRGGERARLGRDDLGERRRRVCGVGRRRRRRLRRVPRPYPRCDGRGGALDPFSVHGASLGRRERRRGRWGQRQRQRQRLWEGDDRRHRVLSSFLFKKSLLRVLCFLPAPLSNGPPSFPYSPRFFRRRVCGCSWACFLRLFLSSVFRFSPHQKKNKKTSVSSKNEKVENTCLSFSLARAFLETELDSLFPFLHENG